MAPHAFGRMISEGCVTEPTDELRRHDRTPLGMLAALGALVLVVAFVPLELPDLMPHYVAVHGTLEILAIAIALAIFAVGWNSDRQGTPLPLVIIATAFLGVALLDLGHVLSFVGMPDFVTPASEEKTIRFWLAARLVAALALAVAMLMPWRPPGAGRWLRWGLLAAVLSVVLAVHAAVLVLPDALPRTFHPDTGLTPVKIATEYLVIALHLTAATALWLRRKSLPSIDITSLMAAILIIVLAEVLFTLYETVSDTHALMGHLYKLVAYFYLFRALVIGGIETPYRQLAGARARLKATLEALPDTIFELDRDGIVHQFHSNDPDVLVAPAQALGRSIHEFLPDRLSQLLGKLLEDVHRHGRSRTFEYSLEVRGERRYFEAAGNRLEVPPGSGEHFIVFVRDVTEARRLDHELRIAAAAFESQEGICITDAQHRILRVNSAFTLITGYSGEDLAGRRPEWMLEPDESNHVKSVIDAAMARRGQWRGEVRLRHRFGSIHPQLLMVTAVRDDSGEASNFIYDYIDVSALKKARDRLQQLALYDPLTGLGNRRLLERRLEEAVEACRHARQHGGLLLINLVGFKRINDAMGINAGDQLLKEVARQLQQLAVDLDSDPAVCRESADEFAVIAPNLGPDRPSAAEAVGRIAGRISGALDRVHRIDGQDYHNHCRIGATVFDGHGSESLDVFNQAAIALHQVKQDPDQTFSLFDERMQAAVTQQQNVESDLRQAIRDERFELYYQPKVDRERRIVGAEALIRWHHPRHGLLQPGEFIPIAEQTGLIEPIEKWTLTAAVRQLAAWQASAPRHDWSMSVNIASSQLYRSDFESSLRDLLDEHRIRSDRLIIELTESTLLHDVYTAREKIRALAALGVRFSIDDFGTGYSSLAYLGRLPVHELKIDRSFVYELDGERFNADIVRLIIEMAHILNLQVVAEGVETESQMSFLVEHGCELMQGFLFGKPRPIAEIERAG